MISKAIQEFKEETTLFLNFLKNPKELPPTKQSFDTKVKIFSILFLLEIILHIFLIIPISYLIDYFLPLQSEDLTNFTLIEELFIFCIIAPIFEEAIFRLPLRYLNNYLFILGDRIYGKGKIKEFWRKNFRWFFYAFAIGFGVIHSSNFENERTFLFFLLIPFITLSQISGGLILGYLRLKLGFWYGVLYHTIFNFLFIFISYSAYHNTELFHYKTDKVEINASYLETKEGSNTSYFINEKDGNIKKLEAKNYPFKIFTETVFKKEYISKDVQLFHFNLKSKEGITRKELLKILKQEIELDSLK